MMNFFCFTSQYPEIVIPNQDWAELCCMLFPTKWPCYEFTSHQNWNLVSYSSMSLPKASRRPLMFLFAVFLAVFLNLTGNKVDSSQFGMEQRWWWHLKDMNPHSGKILGQLWTCLFPDAFLFETCGCSYIFLGLHFFSNLDGTVSLKYNAQKTMLILCVKTFNNLMHSCVNFKFSLLIKKLE